MLMARSLEKPKLSAEGGGNPCTENTEPFIRSPCTGPCSRQLESHGIRQMTTSTELLSFSPHIIALQCQGKDERNHKLTGMGRGDITPGDCK